MEFDGTEFSKEHFEEVVTNVPNRCCGSNNCKDRDFDASKNDCKECLKDANRAFAQAMEGGVIEDEKTN